MSTNNCGCNDTTLNINCQEPVVDCGCPIIPTDASCIYYNLTKDTGGLPCLGIANGTNLKTVLEGIDTKLCQLTPFSFNVYDLSCLTDTYVISNFQDFAEAISTEVCTIKGNIVVINNSLITLNNLINTINIPVINNSCIGIVPTDTLKQVLQKIVTYIDCTITSPVDTSPSIVATDSSTIDFTTSGTKNHNITATVKISNTVGNSLSVSGTGLFVPAPPTDTPQTLSYNNGTRVISLSNGGGSVTLPPDLDNQTLSTNVPNKLITISGGNTIDLTPMFTSLSISETSLTATDSNTIDFTTSGTANHVITGNVKLDTTQPNAISSNSNGLYAKEEQILNTTDSYSIRFTTSGTNNHNLTGDVMLDTTQPNALVITPTGLYVPLTLTDITKQNGVSGVSGVIELGGTLLKHTSITDPNISKQFNFALNAKSIVFGSEYGTYLSATNEFEFGVINKKNINSSTLINNNSYYEVCVNNNIIGTGKVISSISALLQYENTVDATIPNSTPITGQLSGISIKALNKNTTVTQASGLSGPATRAISGAYNYVNLSPEVSANTSAVSHAASTVIASPYYLPAGNNFPTITNYYGLLINPSDAFSASIVNNYGIYQEGINDINFFAGKNSFGTYAVPTSFIDINSTGHTALRLRQQFTPSSSADANGQVGNITWDDNYFYVKVSTGWKRAALSTF